MPPASTPYVKNVSRRRFSELVDPSPSQQEEAAIWLYFASCCAYCGRALRKEHKEGHLDHLVSASAGGPNAIGSRVLSCASCNEKEKLDRPWEQFLRIKAASDEFKKRRDRIREWQEQHPLPNGPNRQRLLEIARKKADDVIAVFEAKVADVRRVMATSKR